MKNILTNLMKILEEAKKIIIVKKNGNLQKLEEIRIRFSKEIDQYIEGFYKKRNFVQEALKKKSQLKKFKVGFFKYLSGIRLRFIISIPFIGAMIIPAIILHIFLEIYHRICFPLYGVPTLKARNYFVFDRHHLAYLNWLEKIFCIYCSYYNCLLAYAREIAGLTELYWCPIKHAKKVGGAHGQYYIFVNYLEGNEYREKKELLRSVARQDEIKKSPKK